MPGKKKVQQYIDKKLKEELANDDYVQMSNNEGNAENDTSKQINCLELFAGCGGLGYGFHKEGFNMVCSSELDANISGTYKKNFHDTTVITGDITKPDIKTQIYDCFKDINCDIILGGPPCVAYSMSGHRNSRDPRGQLFNDYIAVVNKLQPKVFVMENVKGILTIMHDKPKLTKEEKVLADKYYKLEEEKIKYTELKKNLVFHNSQDSEQYKNNETNIKQNKKDLKNMSGDIGKFRMKVTDIIKDKFNDIGYNVDMKLLKASDFGVPQNRERVIFIGVKTTIAKTITYPVETHNADGSDNKKKHKTVREAIDDLKDQPENKEQHHIYSKHSESFVDKIKNTNIGESVNKKYSEAYFRCWPNKPSNTVKENHGGVFVHYEKNRVMTPRELARLQSFPDDFKFNGSKSSVLLQLGNAVPCGLSSAIAKEIKKIFV